jgi:transposase
MRGVELLDQVVDLAVQLATQPATTTTRIASELVADIRALTIRANALKRELNALTQTVVPQLLALQGCGPLTAAKLYGETANINRFRSRAAYAMHTGTAPIRHLSRRRRGRAG